jgi:AAA15 family ATPase/GTPase
MIERVSVGNFKAISSKLELTLAPLTLFVGENGAGKSTVLEAIALLAQSARPTQAFGLQPVGRLTNLGTELANLYHGKRTDEALHVGG